MVLPHGKMYDLNMVGGVYKTPIQAHPNTHQVVSIQKKIKKDLNQIVFFKNVGAFST